MERCTSSILRPKPQQAGKSTLECCTACKILAAQRSMVVEADVEVTQQDDSAPRLSIALMHIRKACACNTAHSVSDSMAQTRLHFHASQ